MCVCVCVCVYVRVQAARKTMYIDRQGDKYGISLNKELDAHAKLPTSPYVNKLLGVRASVAMTPEYKLGVRADLVFDLADGGSQQSVIHKG